MCCIIIQSVLLGVKHRVKRHSHSTKRVLFLQRECNLGTATILTIPLGGKSYGTLCLQTSKERINCLRLLNSGIIVDQCLHETGISDKFGSTSKNLAHFV